VLGRECLTTNLHPIMLEKLAKTYPGDLLVARTSSDLVRLIRTASKWKRPVLLTGLPGVGKTYLAQRLKSWFKGVVDLDDFAAEVTIDGVKKWISAPPKGYLIYVGFSDNLYSIIKDFKFSLIIYVIAPHELFSHVQAVRAASRRNPVDANWEVLQVSRARMSPADYRRRISANVGHLIDFLRGRRSLLPDGSLHKEKTDANAKSRLETLLVIYQNEVQGSLPAYGWHGYKQNYNRPFYSQVLRKS